MEKYIFNRNLLIKILSCLVLNTIIMNNNLNFIIIAPILIIIIITNRKILKMDKNASIGSIGTCTIYDYLIETTSLIYFFFLFDEVSIIYRIILCIIVNTLILFENNIKKIDFMNSTISHNLIALPFLILLLISLPK